MIRLHEELLREFQVFALTAPTGKSIMERIARRLHEKMTRYNWVGFTSSIRRTRVSCWLDLSSAASPPMLAFLSTRDCAVPQPGVGKSW
jgi:hypothetical protein